jgi:hypothetical protein
VLIMRCRSWVVDVVPCGLSLPPYILCSTCCLCFGWEKKTRIIVSLKKKCLISYFKQQIFDMSLHIHNNVRSTSLRKKSKQHCR